MMSAASICGSENAGTPGIGEVFSGCHEELEWLANFLIGDAKLAAACVIDACGLAESCNPSLEEWLLQWARLATMRSALEIQRSRIAQLSPAYVRRPCPHKGHAALSQDSFEAVIDQSRVLISRLDVLCRFALVTCGIERRSTLEAALFLGIDPTSVEGAYCAALHSLEVITCEQLQQQNNYVAVCN